MPGQEQQEQEQGFAASPGALVLGNPDLLGVILKSIDARQPVMRALSLVCHQCWDACVEVQRGSTAKLPAKVFAGGSFGSTLSGIRAWSNRFMGSAADARLALRCWRSQGLPHLPNTLLFNSIALQAAGPGLRSLHLRLPHLLAHSADRVLAPPALKGLTELRLDIQYWNEAERSTEAHRSQDYCVHAAAAALARGIKPLTALQLLDVSLPFRDGSGEGDILLANVAPSLPRSLTSLAVAAGCFPYWTRTAPERRTPVLRGAALADLAHLSGLRRLHLDGVLSDCLHQAPPAALAAALTSLEIVHTCTPWRDYWLEGVLSGGVVLPVLRRLHLCHCRLDDTDALIAAAAPELQDLRLGGRRPSQCPQFGLLTQLTRLVVGFQSYYSIEPSRLRVDGLAGLSQLSILELQGCSLQHGAAALPPLPQLAALVLRECKLEGRLCLSGSPQLTALQLSCCSWEGLLCCSDVPDLRKLCLAGRWDDAFPRLVGLEVLWHLTHLSLRYSKSPRLRPEQLAALPQLAVLLPAKLAPPGWLPAGAAEVERAADAGGAAGGDSGHDSDSDSGHDSDSGSDSVSHYSFVGSGPPSRLASEAEPEEDAARQWELLSGMNRFFYT